MGRRSTTRRTTRNSSSVAGNEILVSKLFRRPKNSEDRKFPLFQVSKFAAAELRFQESEESDVELSRVIHIIVPSVGDDEKVRRGSCGVEEMEQLVGFPALTDVSVFGEFHF